MTIRSHIESAEESLRQALINSLAEKKDTHLSSLFEALNNVRSILNTYPLDTPYRFNLTSEYLSNSQVKYDLTGLDENPYGNNVITFSGIGGASSEDVISLGLD